MTETMSHVRLVCLVCAVLCFTLKALGFKSEKYDLIAAGFAFVTASWLP